MALVATGLTTHILNNHLKSALLLAGFPFLLVLMLGAFFAGLDAFGQSAAAGQGISAGHAWQAAVAGIMAYGHYMILAAGVWFIIAYFFHGSMMRMATHSRPVTRAEMPKIYNMLENLCISRGISMPAFEVIDSPALNAFATGINQETYKIVLTRGIIERLEDDELEAVIAHELTHIMNRDVRLLIISVIFVGMISFFAELGFRALVHGGGRSAYRSSGNNNRNGGGHLAVLLIGLAVLAVGYLFALGIRFALSRKREFLADAGAVELTKNPEAMMRALMRISGQDKVADMPDEVQQMCIENSQRFMGMFATHPPIERRIRVISEMTGTPVPQLTVSLRRAPKAPWGEGNADAPQSFRKRGPWSL